MQVQLLADHDVEHAADRCGFVHLGHDGAVQAAALVGAHHFVQRFVGRGRVQAQQALHVGARAGQHGDLLGHHVVALRHADGVDQHGVLVAQFLQGDAQVGFVLHRVHHHAQDLAVDAQLLVAADTVGVGGDQGQLVRAVAHHAARGQLGGGGGLADAGRADQGVHAALLQQRVFVADGGQVTGQHGLNPAHGFGGILSRWHFFNQEARQGGRETGGQHLAQHGRLLRLALGGGVPRQFGQLGFHQAAHGADLAHHAVHFGGGRFLGLGDGGAHHRGHGAHVDRRLRGRRAALGVGRGWLGVGWRHRCGWRGRGGVLQAARQEGRSGGRSRCGRRQVVELLQLQVRPRLGHFRIGGRRGQRGHIVVVQRQDLDLAVDWTVGEDDGIRPQRFAHLAQCISGSCCRKFLNLHLVLRASIWFCMTGTMPVDRKHY